ncbi:MAG: phage tail protein [Chloroflexi bacterium]|nr:phage tail protein [Chloroflexota bacterium]
MGLRDSLIKATPSAVDEFTAAPIDSLEEYPIANYAFTIKIGDSPVALFQKVSGMTVQRSIDELTEGGFNEYTFEFPREFGYNHIIFESGLSSSDFFYKWMMYGKEQGFAMGKGFVLEQKFPDKPADTPKSWTFDGAFPVRWTISDLDITNSNTIVIETLELSFNFFQLD